MSDQHLINIKVQLNRRQLKMMKQQEQVENKRMKQLNRVRDILERKRLKNIHAIERARFSEKLKAVVEQHQRLIRQYEEGKKVTIPLFYDFGVRNCHTTGEH